MKKETAKDHKISLRLRADEYAKIHAKWKDSLCPHFSEYVRRTLFSKPIIIKTRNRSLDGFMEEAIQLRNEIIRLQDRYIESLDALHTQGYKGDSKFSMAAFALDTERMLNSIDEVKRMLHKVAETWLR